MTGFGDGLGGHGGCGGAVGGCVAEVAGGAAAGGDEELGAFEVDVVAGEAVGDVTVGLLDGGVRVEIFDEEHVVLDDGGDLVGAVRVAHVFVVHGHGMAAGSVLLVVVHALVRLGWFASEVLVAVGHFFHSVTWCFVARIAVVGGESLCSNGGCSLTKKAPATAGALF